MTVTVWTREEVAKLLAGVLAAAEIQLPRAYQGLQALRVEVERLRGWLQAIAETDHRADPAPLAATRALAGEAPPTDVSG